MYIFITKFTYNEYIGPYFFIAHCSTIFASDLHECFKEFGLHAQNMIPIVSSIVNQIEWHVWPFDERKNLHFDNQVDVHTSS
jgi:hypothetical protein